MRLRAAHRVCRGAPAAGASRWYIAPSAISLARILQGEKLLFWLPAVMDYCGLSSPGLALKLTM
ncbi:MAG: hypothetical protein ACRD1J_03375 [Terriglobia bacterium]